MSDDSFTAKGLEMLRSAGFPVAGTHSPTPAPADTDDSRERCPTPCDDDCDANCHEWHQSQWKRDHQPSGCPAARPAEPTGELREQVLSFFCTRYQLSIPTEVTDALLSGPLAPLLAKLQAVEALARQWENFGSRYTLTAGLGAEELRRALDGTQ